MWSRAALASAALVIACQGSDGKSASPPPPPATAVSAGDAGALAVDGGVTTLPSFDPGTGFHLDEAPAARPAGRVVTRERKVAQILLRSTPAGAIAAVDGVRLGTTPVLWEGWLDGQAHEFTFVMAGHSLARYRFVPVTGGIVHGSLVKITDDRDAGVPAIPAAVPSAPSAPPASSPERPPPPPPVDAAPAPVDAAVAAPFGPPP